MPIGNQIAVLVALAVVAIIGFDMLVRQPGTRGERSGVRELLPDGVDPAELRRRTPRSQRLAGAVLISAAAVTFAAAWPAL
jgi:hypothetical protein